MSGALWSDAAAAQLMALWADGLSYKQIAMQLGMSRGKVSGKIGRLQLPRRPIFVDWSKEEDATLRRMWADGVGITRIATTLHRSVDSVVNKAKRIGLRKRAKPRTKASGRLVAIRRVANFRDKPECTLVPSRMVPLIDLRRGMGECRWPIGNPAGLRHDIRRADFGFCGHPAEDGLPYCASHCRLAYRPPDVRLERLARVV